MKIRNRPLMRVDGFFDTKGYKRSCQWQVLCIKRFTNNLRRKDARAVFEKEGEIKRGKEIIYIRISNRRTSG